MGSAAVFSGLETGFGLLGKAVLDDQKRAEDEASEERKAKLKAKLEMDLMAAKFNFMKQNPQYKHFATDLSGNIIGFDQYGSPKVVHEASAEEKSIRLDKARAEASGKDSADTKNLAEADAATARAEFNRARTADPGRFMKPSAGPKTPKLKPDPYILTPGKFDEQVKKYMPKLIVDNAGPGNASFDKAYDIASKRATAEGYSVGRQPGSTGIAAPAETPAQPDSGVFSGLIPQDGTVSDDEEPDESDASPLLMDDDEDNR